MKEKKTRATETGTLVGVRLQADQLAALDAWRGERPGVPSRPEAVRQLIEAGLQAGAEAPASPARPASPIVAMFAAFREFVIETATAISPAGADEIARRTDAAFRRELGAVIEGLPREPQQPKSRKKATRTPTPPATSAKQPAPSHRARPNSERKRARSTVS